MHSKQPESSKSTLPTSTEFLDPIPGILAYGAVGLLAGEARVGKSPLLISWIPRWEAGKTIMGHATNKPTGFCYLVGDRSWDAYQKWFDRVGHPGIPHYTIDDDLEFPLLMLDDPKQGYRVLVNCLDKLELLPGSLLIIEPYAPTFMNGNQNDPRNVAAGLHKLRRLCKQFHITIIAMVHFHKDLPAGEIAITLMGEDAREYIELSSRLSELAHKARQAAKDATVVKSQVQSILKENQ